VDSDGDSVVDYVYAGDMFGNMWKFDLTSGTPSDWGSAVESGNSPAPMFTAESAAGDPQPITVRPQIGRHPAGKNGRMVYFGTGKYIGAGDNISTGQTTQSFYGIWDRVESNGNQTVFDRSELLEQEVTNEVSVDANNTPGDVTDDSEVRITSDNDIAQWYGDGTGSNPGKGGWFIDLVDGNDGNNHGEKAVTDPVLRNDRIIFTTLIPSQSPCDFGGGGWLMELSSRDGGHLAEPSFDLNDDATFDGNDTHNGTNPGGLKSKIGIVPTPAIMLTPDRTESKFMSGSTGEVDSVTENSGDEDRGRQAWEELR
jgi:type IV pilus assembly protein PilY1